jgi:hypothetical protein
MALRSLIQRRVNDAKVEMDKLVDVISNHFSKITTEFKPGIYIISYFEHFLFLIFLSSLFDIVLELYKIAFKDSYDNVPKQGGYLLRRFVHRICSLLESCCHVNHSASYFAPSQSTLRSGQGRGPIGQPDFQIGYVYDESPMISTPNVLPWILGGNLISKKKESDVPTLLMSEIRDETIYVEMWKKILSSKPSSNHIDASPLITFGCLRRISLSLISRLETELQVLELQSDKREHFIKV